MVTLRLLGSVSLDGEEGPVTGRAAQRRRIALLALLALARGQALSRDKLIGYLWAESDEEKARRLLSESLYVIRKSLGEDAVLTSGDDLQLNREVVWTDALAFLESLEKGEEVAAAELYRGPFLDGFYLADAPEFEQWVDGERSRLERSFADTLRKLATAAENKDDAKAAVVWWRRLANLDRYDAQVAVAYMKALEAAGQRAAALQVARVHAALFREEFDAEPDPEVERLAERLREAPQHHTPQPSGSDPKLSGPGMPSSFGSAESGEAEPADPVAGTKPKREKDQSGEETEVPLPLSAPGATGRPRLSGRAWIVGGAGAAGLTAILAAALFFGQERSGPAPGPPPDRTVIAVIPFTIQGEVGPTLREGGLVTLLNINLDGFRGLRSVDQGALWHFLGRPGTDESVSREAAREAARHFGASHFVLGRIVGGGDGQIRVAAALLSVDTPMPDPPEVVVDGSSEDPISLADSLIVGLLAGVQEASGERLLGIAARTSQAIPALEAYLEGEEEFRATRYGRAKEAFERAIEEDETFALAHYRRSISALLDLKFSEARLAADRAVRYSGRLTGRDRRLLAAWNNLMEGEAEAAEREYLRILRDYPDEVEAHFGLGQARIFYGPSRGISPTVARENFEDVLRLNPSYGQARFHLMELAASRRDIVAFDSLFLGIDPESDQALSWEAVRAFWTGGEREQEEVRRRLLRADPLVAGLGVARVAAHLQDFPAAEGLAEVLTGADRDADTRAAAQILIAMIRFARGRWQGGMEALTLARQFDPAWATELEALYTGFPLRNVSRQEALTMRETLAAWDAEEVALSTNFVLFAHNGFHSSLRVYLLALTSLWAGEPDRAVQYAGELSRVHRDPELAATAAAWARTIRGRASAVRGRVEEAIGLLEGTELKAPLERITISPFFSRAFDRYLLGQLLTTAGRPEEALAWLGTLTEGSEVVLVGPAHLEMARIRDARGEPEKAIRHYEQFLELWVSSDPEFRPLLEEARERIAALRGGGDPTP